MCTVPILKIVNLKRKFEDYILLTWSAFKNIDWLGYSKKNVLFIYVLYWKVIRKKFEREKNRSVFKNIDWFV